MLTIVLLFYAYGCVLVCCECCQRSNQAYEECDNMIAQFDWYLFPSEVQRILPLILALTRQPFEVNVFVSVTGDRELFKYVCLYDIN